MVLKFFLHISQDEQRRRFLSRIEEPEKNWKFAAGDVKERALWDDYMEAYEDAIRATATKDSPWFVVPADNKWFTRLIVAGAPTHLLPGGWLLIEHGNEQGAAVRGLFQAQGFAQVATARDLERRERVTRGQWLG